MSNDSMGKRKNALENDYFAKKNADAMKRLQSRQEETAERPSPIDGKPMEQITMMGVVIDRCASSGGIWLDKGEFEQLMQETIKQYKEENESGGAVSEFLKSISGWGSGE